MISAPTALACKFLLVLAASAVALQLLKDASCTEEQIDAVALLARSMQKRFEAREEKSSPMLPVATPSNNHRAVWLGGGGVGKTRTLSLVVRRLAETFFGRQHNPTRRPRTWAPRVALSTLPTVCS